MKKNITKVIMVVMAIIVMTFSSGFVAIVPEHEESEEATTMQIGKYMEVYTYDEEYNIYKLFYTYLEEDVPMFMDWLESINYESSSGEKVYFVRVDVIGHEEMYMWSESQPSPYDLLA